MDEKEQALKQVEQSLSSDDRRDDSGDIRDHRAWDYRLVPNGGVSRSYRKFIFWTHLPKKSDSFFIQSATSRSGCRSSTSYSRWTRTSARSGQTGLKLAEPLKSLNDVRVRFAHHAHEKGKDPLEIAQDDADLREVFPSLKPNETEAGVKWKKKAIRFDEIATFARHLTEVIENMTDLIRRMEPIYLEPKRSLVAKIKELQQKVAEQSRARC